MGNHKHNFIVVGFFLSLSFLSGGCSTAPKHLYEGPKQAENNLVLIRAADPYRASLYAINGERLYRAESIFIEPGEHLLVARVRMNHQVDLMSYQMQTFCGFRLNAASRESYDLRADNKVHKGDAHGDQISLGAQLEGGTDEDSVAGLGCAHSVPS